MLEILDSGNMFSGMLSETSLKNNFETKVEASKPCGENPQEWIGMIVYKDLKDTLSQSNMACWKMGHLSVIFLAA